MELVDRYEICPACGHDWIAHFGMIRFDAGGKDYLTDPYPHECVECPEPLCTLAMDLEILDKIMR